MAFTVKETGIKDLLLVVQPCFPDDRGFFTEVYRKDSFDTLKLPSSFLQLNHSRSAKDVVRGLHFQWDPPMAKLMRVVSGRAFLVAVDIRYDSKTLGKWFGIEVSSESSEKIELFAPAGFARGFCALSENIDVEYLCTGVYNPKGESGIRWNDPDIGIKWPVKNPILSPKDSKAQTLKEWLKRPESKNFTVERGFK